MRGSRFDRPGYVSKGGRADAGDGVVIRVVANDPDFGYVSSQLNRRIADGFHP